MKKRTFKRLAVITAALALVSTTAVAGTMAKYISIEEATVGGQVAKWSIAFEQKDAGETDYDAWEEAQTFLLYDTVKTGNIDTSNSKKLIAPGTSGSYSIKVTNNSEVTVNVDVVHSELTNKPANLVHGTANNVSDVVLEPGESMEVVWNWSWEYGSDDGVISNEDAEDNLDGAAGKTISGTIKVTATQVAPATV